MRSAKLLAPLFLLLLAALVLGAETAAADAFCVKRPDYTDPETVHLIGDGRGETIVEADLGSETGRDAPSR